MAALVYRLSPHRGRPLLLCVMDSQDYDLLKGLARAIFLARKRGLTFFQRESKSAKKDMRKTPSIPLRGKTEVTSV